MPPIRGANFVHASIFSATLHFLRLNSLSSNVPTGTMLNIAIYLSVSLVDRIPQDQEWGRLILTA